MNDVAEKPRSVQLEGPIDTIPITFVGHPWAPIGMGEQLRSHIAALSSLHMHHTVLDIYRYAARTDAGHEEIIGDREIREPPGGIRIFHVNGDEVDTVFTTFEARGGVIGDGFNIVVPAWELPIYPAEWAEKLRRFDEVWALSTFIRASLKAAGIESHLIGQAIEPLAGPLLPRRHFGIRESAYVLLNFFDLSSYASRKNPEAVLALFDRLRAANPYADIQLVLKAKQGERGAEAWAREWAATHGAAGRIHVLATPLDTLGVRSLITACDCFVSLHRAEGFGRGLGEAMALGRLAMGTNWSGNTDFLNPSNGLAINYELVPLQDGDYPHWEGQSWAEPDVGHAFEVLNPIIHNPSLGRAIARKGQVDVLHTHGNRAVGLRIVDRLERIIAA